MWKNLETRSGEALTALIGIALSGSLLVSDPNLATVIMADVMPQWAIFNICCSCFCLFSCFLPLGSKCANSSRFISGCIWGTFILMFAMAGAWLLPLLWIAIVLFIFDMYLVMVKGQSWAERKTS